MSQLDDLLEQIEDLEQESREKLEEIESLQECEELRVKYLGRNGEIQELFGQLGQLPDEARAKAGKGINQLKSSLEKKIEEKQEKFEQLQKEKQLEEESIDVTMPGRRRGIGKRHVITQVQDDLTDIFKRMGFSLALGPEVESDYYNFEALNIPELHPARDEWDSLYVDEENLLRTHTSPVQIREMEKGEPPVKIICPGKCYRRDTPDATHYPVFHQVELLWVDEELTFANLKYLIRSFVEEFFGPEFSMRFRADYFPFTEPSAEVDIMPPNGEDWLEIMGSGMVDPSVLKAVDYDPENYQGFALGLGVERMAMLKYGIDDIRLFYRNDLRFLDQF
ncbi:phenylalanine--tRNA ligase subunit alpha [Candidatus Bipolaricaulota bacterium]|nr:phenylalanine--tRNA ligase subunit alpha [Candidatus Bipolaricaulota bacterium]